MNAKKMKVLATRSIYPDAMEWLREFAQVEVPEGEASFSRTEILERIPGKEGLLSLLTDRIDGSVMDASQGSLKVIANMAVGFDNIDLNAAKQRGIAVTNTPGVLTEATADLTWALMLSLARKIVSADRHVRKGRFRGWGPMDFLGWEFAGKILGIVGMGRIGRAVARRAFGFGMRVLYTTRTRPVEPLFRDWPAIGPGGWSPRQVPLKTLLSEADIISLHVPLTRETTHLIDGKAMAAMKPEALLINTARGPVVDESALVDALQHGRLRGAGLDVYEKEPELTTGLADLDNVVLLPHIGSATHETRRRMGMMAVENLWKAHRGEPLPNRVDA